MLGGSCDRGAVISLMMSLHVNLFVIQNFSASAFEGFGVSDPLGHGMTKRES